MDYFFPCPGFGSVAWMSVLVAVIHFRVGLDETLDMGEPLGSRWQDNGKIGWELGSFLSLAGAGEFGVVAETPRSWSRSRIWLCMTAPSAIDALLT
jgi:hypothetical protein